MRTRHWLAVLIVALAAGVAGLVVFRASTSGQGGGVTLGGAGGRYSVTVVLDRATPGEVSVQITVQTAQRTPADVDAVSVSAAMPGMGHATSPLVARRGADGRYLARGELFAMAGVWQLGIDVRGASGAEFITVDVAVRS
jgi:hypothetical protein